MVDVSTDNSRNHLINPLFQTFKFRDDREKEIFKRCAFDATNSNVRAWVDANEMGLGGGKPNRFDPSVQDAERRSGNDFDPVEYCQGQFRKKIDNTLGRDEHLCLAAEFDCPGEFDAILIGMLVSCFVSYNLLGDLTSFVRGSDFSGPTDDSAAVLIPVDFVSYCYVFEFNLLTYREQQ